MIHCDKELLVPTAGLETAKLHWNSVVSTAMAGYMFIDLKNFFLTAKLEYYKYMTIPLTYFPTWIVKQYNLNLHALNGKVHLELQRTVWGLQQAGILANKQLRQNLAPFRYKEHVNTPGLWYHETCPILFTLSVDDFGIKYVNRADEEHLLTSLQATYKLTADWTGDLYCGIALGWDYNKRYVVISMPGYVKKKLQEYGHAVPNQLQRCPYAPEPKQFGATAQALAPPNDTPKLNNAGIKLVQKSWEAYYIMPAPSTCQSSWPSAPSRWNKQKLLIGH